MKGQNFLVLGFSLLPLVSGVYKFQVLVSFPSPHLRVLTRGPHQQGVVGGSSERWFCFQYSCWLVDQFPKMIWRCSLTSKSPTECTDFCRFLTIYSPFYGSRLYFGKGQGYLWIKNASKCQKKFNLVPLSCSRIEWRCFEVDEIFPGSTSCALFVWKMSFEIPIFCLNKLINSCQGWELFVQEFWTGLKLYSQTSTVFKKMPWKWKCCFQYSQMT